MPLTLRVPDAVDHDRARYRGTSRRNEDEAPTDPPRVMTAPSRRPGRTRCEVHRLTAERDDRTTTETSEDPLIAAFKQNLASYLDNSMFTRRFILHGECAAIENRIHYDLKAEIASRFSLEVTTDVFVVGSAKLGFSIAPHKRFKPFNDTSDIDVAIINHELYKSIWHEVHEFKMSGEGWRQRRDFESYLSWGWIRPDKLPKSRYFSFTNEWWDFFRSLQQRRIGGPYKISGALYHDLDFLVRYQNNAVDLCRLQNSEVM